MKASVVVAILNYNGRALVERCARSFINQSVLPDRVLFVDNGSDDFTESWVREAFGERFASKLEFVILTRNVGYTHAFNTVFRILLSEEKPPDWVMTLNNDTELHPDYFKNLFSALGKPETLTGVGTLSPKVLSLEDPTQLDSTGIGLCLDGMSTARGQNEKDHGQYDESSEILAASGVAAIYRLDMLREVGLLDEIFYSYCEDTDLSLRAWWLGWSAKYIPETVLYHQRSATHGRYSLRKLYLVERNHFWVVVKCFPMPLVLLNPVFGMMRYLWQIFFLIGSRGQGIGFGETHGVPKLVVATLRAFRDAVWGLPFMWRKRRELMRARKRGNLEAVREIWKHRTSFRNLVT